MKSILILIAIIFTGCTQTKLIPHCIQMDGTVHVFTTGTSLKSYNRTEVIECLKDEDKREIK